MKKNRARVERREGECGAATSHRVTPKEPGCKACRHLWEECSRMNKQVVPRLVKHLVYSATRESLVWFAKVKGAQGGRRGITPHPRLRLLPD